MKTSDHDMLPVQYERTAGEDINFAGLFNAAMDARRHIILATLIALILGAAYAYLSSPVYRADALIQVEDTENTANTNTFGALVSAFSVKSPAAAEIEILRSRLVVGQAADTLQLFVTAHPRYIPFVGAWMARHASGLSAPGIYGLGGYVSGAESIKLRELEVPQDLEGRELILTANSAGYDLRGPDGQLLARGKIGLLTQFEPAAGPGRIQVDSLAARPGAQFVVMRRSRLEMITALQEGLQISEVGKQPASGVLSMSLQGTDPERITRILNAVGAAYVRQNIERKAAEAQKSLAFLDGYLPQLKKQLDESETKYTDFRNLHSTFDLTAEGSLSLNTAVALQTDLLQLQQKRRELISLYAGAHPAVKVVDQQIAALNTKIEALTARIKTLPHLEQQLLDHVRNVKVNGDLYASLLNSAQQLRVIKEGKVGNVRMVDAAVTPEQPIQPNRPMVMTIAAILGLLLGTGMAWLRNWMRPGIQNPEDIESALGIAVLATVPHSAPQVKLYQLARKRAAGSHVLALNAPRDPAVESLRSLRMSVQHAMLNTTNHVVLLTGATPNVGKSFASVNFAAVLGAGGRRVLLIDADLRGGSINQYFGLERSNGFSELVNGQAGLEDVLHKNVMPNVDLITTGALPGSPAELLLSASVQPLLQSLSMQYDLVLVDTTPVLAVSDAMALARHAAMVLMVARADSSTLDELEESARRLQRQAGVPVEGVIFNDIDATSRRYGSSRYQYAGYQ